jgi:hypothetical protein
MYHVCQSVHARGGIHTIITLSLRVSSIQNLVYRIRKGYDVSYVASTRQQPRGHPGKARSIFVCQRDCWCFGRNSGNLRLSTPLAEIISMGDILYISVGHQARSQTRQPVVTAHNILSDSGVLISIAIALH